jgi:hypothetical protein
VTHTDEYELFLGYVYKLAERRQSATATYLSVNAALTGALAFLFKDGHLSGLTSLISALIFLFSGVVACGLWRRLITHYSTLMGWWYEQLRTLEDIIPSSSKLITKEYQELFVRHGSNECDSFDARQPKPGPVANQHETQRDE